MRFATLFMILTSVAAAGSEIVLPATRQAHVLILNEVYLNGDGPFRMMVDTGNASSLLSPAIARRLGLQAAGSLEQSTASGVRRVPVAWIQEVRAGAALDRDVEMMIAEPRLPGIEGVLGQSWLVRHDYTVDLRHRRVVLDGAPPDTGRSLPLRSIDGVPAIVAEVDGRRREVVLDSGAPALVLFESAPLHTVRLETNAGAVGAELGRSLVSLGGLAVRSMRSVRVNAPGSRTDLLPLCEFDAVHVSNREGFVVVAP